MSRLVERKRARLARREGFVLPTVIFALVIMTTIAIVALRTSVDEQQSTRAVRSSATAYYAAEAGLNAVQAVWNDTTNNFDSLAAVLVAGDSLIVGASWQATATVNGTAFKDGWHTLANGAKYQATIHRLDTAGQMLFMISVEGRDAHDLGERRLRVFVTPAPSGAPGGLWTLGNCCDAAATVRGAVRISDSDDFVDGHDELPPGWGTKDECPDMVNKPGLIMDDTDLLDLEDGWIDGEPALVEDATLNDSTFDYFGELTWQEIKDMATIVISSVGGGQIKLDLAPSYVGGACDTSDPENWGSNDPNDLCYDYYPVVLIQGEVEIKTGYGQGIVLLDLLDPVTGSEFELEGGFFAGLIIGKGCVEIQDGSDMWGAVFVDANYFNESLCNEDTPLRTHDHGTVTWSSCAINKVLGETGVAEAANPINVGSVQKLDSRALEQVLGKVSM
jgi:hypothetical protein